MIEVEATMMWAKGSRIVIWRRHLDDSHLHAALGGHFDVVGLKS